MRTEALRLGDGWRNSTEKELSIIVSGEVMGGSLPVGRRDGLSMVR